MSATTRLSKNIKGKVVSTKTYSQMASGATNGADNHVGFDVFAKRSNRDSISEWEHTKGDRSNILLLFFLYVLQGVPLGISGCIPLMLLDRNVTYSQQALFSLVVWPFSVKILWAPIVDTLHLKCIGRRKTWLVPAQYMIGLTMIVLSTQVPSLIGPRQDKDFVPNVELLTLAFFFLNFSAATQDIAVDAWALTMLSRKNVGYQSTCNSAGQSAGYFIGNVILLALDSPDFSNKFRSIPMDNGFVTLSSYLMFWGIIFLVTTSLVLVFKSEEQSLECDVPQSILQAYHQLWDILRLDGMKVYIFLALTSKIGFAATDAVAGLKLVEYGMPKEHLAMMAIPITPLQLILPLLVARYTSGPTPWLLFLKAAPYRIFIGLWLTLLTYFGTQIQTESGQYPLWYYVAIAVSYCVYQIPCTIMFVSLIGFIAQVADPKIGGTYMTLMGVLMNLGGNWIQSSALYILDFITWKSCTVAEVAGACANPAAVHECHVANGQCNIDIDGFYIESVVFSCIGLLWLYFCSDMVLKLQSRPLRDWRATAKL